ncbi:GNAT family N-acetyltransferase [Rhodobacterales bacterium HKCCE2091]|nr:GNAT family N-acetyltransferase [Rhodobacterales bacterium HKCCE2091]
MTARLADTPVLTTERLTIRAPEASDIDAFIAFATHERARFIGGGAETTPGQAWRIFAILSGHWHLRGYGTFVYAERGTGRPIGSAGPWHPGNWPEQELGWTVWGAGDEGRGYAHEAMLAIRDHAFGALGWTTAVSYIDPANTRSIALAERLGCTLDPDAPVPYSDEPTLVYRHPAPGTAA